MTYFDDFKFRNAKMNKGKKPRKTPQKGNQASKGSTNLFDFKFCINCGVRLPKKAKSCTNCGSINDITI